MKKYLKMEITEAEFSGKRDLNFESSGFHQTDVYGLLIQTAEKVRLEMIGFPGACKFFKKADVDAKTKGKVKVKKKARKKAK